MYSYKKKFDSYLIFYYFLFYFIQSWQGYFRMLTLFSVHPRIGHLVCIFVLLFCLNFQRHRCKVSFIWLTTKEDSFSPSSCDFAKTKSHEQTDKIINQFFAQMRRTLNSLDTGIGL